MRKNMGYQGGIGILSCIVVTLLLAGCVFTQVRQQQQQLDTFSQLYGTVQTVHPSAHPLVVVLVRIVEETPQIVDHFVLEQAGRWFFAVTAGTYGLAAFEDVNGDLVYQPGESALRVEDETTFTLTPGQVIRDIALRIPSGGRPRIAGEIDLRALQARTIDEQFLVTLGQRMVAGEIVPLTDPRFDFDNGKKGMWSPYDFIFDVGAGIYFLSEYEAQKIPVLFIHGITGTPRNFVYLIEHLDHERLQPWLYYYPSGAHLSSLGDMLSQLILRLRSQYPFKKLYVVAHSMGGLVARAFILRHAAETHRHTLPLFVSLSTPWGGVTSAEQGVKHAPAVVRSWYDIAPSSHFLAGLFWQEPARQTQRRPLPASLAHHLFFGFKRRESLPGASSDMVVTVASELRWEAQQDAVRLYGFDDTHVGILENPEVSHLLNAILAQ